MRIKFATASKNKVLLLTLIGGGLALGPLLAGAFLYSSSWRFRTLVNGLVDGRFTALTLSPGNPVIVDALHDPRIAADYYGVPNSDLLIILVHGSSKEGRRQSWMRILASRLQRAGLSVLVPDLPGFGESDDPSLPLTEDFRFDQAVVRVARQALGEGWASNGEFVYMGYSLGAGVVLRAARHEPRPVAIITVGAPATGELLAERGQQWLEQFALRRLEDMQLVPDEESQAVIERYLLEMDVTKQLSMEDLPPTLLIYGELEDAPPLKRHSSHEEAGMTHVAFIPGAPHSYNTLRVIGPIVVYNRAIADSVVSAAKKWAQRSTR